MLRETTCRLDSLHGTECQGSERGTRKISAGSQVQLEALMALELGVRESDGETAETTPLGVGDARSLGNPIRAIASEIIGNLQAALGQLQAISDDLAQAPGARGGAQVG